MISPGLCSVTLRDLDPAGVIDVVRRAGLSCVEWGGDVHVPPGDLAAASDVRARSEDAGVAIASYGSYFRAGVHDLLDANAILDTAAALGAPRVRIWAGDVDSADASAAQWTSIVASVAGVAEAAAAAGLSVGLEFHRGTLTDTAGSTARLLRELPETVSTYWQPPVGLTDDEALAGLDEVRGRVSTLHVFSWSPTGKRLPLRHRETLWHRVFSHINGAHDGLLEFVPDDDPDGVVRDARTLIGLVRPEEQPA